MWKLGIFFVTFATCVVVAQAIYGLALSSVAGLAGEVRPVRDAVSQTVDRRHKTDRLTPSDKMIRDIAPSLPAPAHSQVTLVIAISLPLNCQCQSV